MSLYVFIIIYFSFLVTGLTYVTWAIDLLAILKRIRIERYFATFCRIFRMRTIVIETLTPLNRTSHIKMHKNNARPRLFWRIAKRSIASYNFTSHSTPIFSDLEILKLHDLFQIKLLTFVSESLKDPVLTIGLYGCQLSHNAFAGTLKIP